MRMPKNHNALTAPLGVGVEFTYDFIAKADKLPDPVSISKRPARTYGQMVWASSCFDACWTVAGLVRAHRTPTRQGAGVVCYGTAGPAVVAVVRQTHRCARAVLSTCFHATYPDLAPSFSYPYLPLPFSPCPRLLP